jgi:chromatin remodeling complex protein RSC6
MVSEEVVNVEEDQLTTRMRNISESIENLTKIVKVLTTEFKLVQKDVSKMKPKKRVKKEVDPDAPKKENALEKPVVITEELCDFLSLTRGELYSRQTITKTINKYVKDHDLQNPENRRFILLDSEPGLKLKALLRDPDQPLTFFNIQRYLKPHYPKLEDDASNSKVKSKVEPAVEPAVESAVEPAVEPEVVPDVKKKVVRKVVRRSPLATPEAVTG